MRKPSYLLMLLPIAGLAAFGYLVRQPKPARTPGLYISQVEWVPPSARDASRGYDGCALITLDYAGAKPKWWGESIGAAGLIDPRTYVTPTTPEPQRYDVGGLLYARVGTKEQLTASLDEQSLRCGVPQWDQKNFLSAGHYSFPCTFKLDAVPKAATALRLLVAAGDTHGPLARKEMTVPKLGRQLPRYAGSRDPGLKIVRLRVLRLPAKDWKRDGNCRVEAVLRQTDASAARGVNLSDSSVVITADGKERGLFALSGGNGETVGGFPTDMPYDSALRMATWSSDTRPLPPGKVIFKSAVGLGDGWLLPILAIIREK